MCKEVFWLGHKNNNILSFFSFSAFKKIKEDIPPSADINNVLKNGLKRVYSFVFLISQNTKLAEIGQDFAVFRSLRKTKKI